MSKEPRKKRGRGPLMLPLKLRDAEPAPSARPQADFGFEPRRVSNLSRSLSVLWACEMSLFSSESLDQLRVGMQQARVS